MNSINVFNNKAVEEKYLSYPVNVQKKLLQLRGLIFEVGSLWPEIGDIEEALKWGEPSFLTIKTGSGSTIRLDWKAKTPENYYLFFNCKTKLVATFKEIYGPLFSYQGNRALVFNFKDNLPIAELKDCIYKALTYHLK